MLRTLLGLAWKAAKIGYVGHIAHRVIIEVDTAAYSRRNPPLAEDGLFGFIIQVAGSLTHVMRKDLASLVAFARKCLEKLGSVLLVLLGPFIDVILSDTSSTGDSAEFQELRT